MPTVNLDVVNNFSVILTGNAQREVGRSFTVEDIDTSVDPYAISIAATNALAAAGVIMGTPHPAYSDALLSRIEIQGLLPNAVAGRLIYTTLQGITPTSYVLTRSTRLVDETANVLPNGQLIKAKLSVTGAPNWQTDYVPMRFMRPCTVLTAEGVRYGTPNYPGADYVGYVNDDTWGGRPKGHWLCAEFTTAWSKYEGVHQFRCAVQAYINGKDWSTFGILRSHQTGKYAYYDGMETDVASAVSETYAYSSDIGGHGAAGKGFVHVGGYPMVGFTTLGL